MGCDNTSELSVNPSINPPGINSKSQVFELIPLPKKAALWMDSVYTISKVIDGSVGGRINMGNYYISDTGDSVVFNVDLRIPAGAFQGTETITITIDRDSAAVHFYPEMVFTKELNLFQSFKGLKLENVPTGTIDFVYLCDDGSIEIIKKNGIQVVVPQEIVRVQNAKLKHFSRYGWVRKSEKTF